MTLDQIIEAIGIEPYHREPGGVIYCAPCETIIPLIPKGAINLCVTDPPYGIDWNTNYSRFSRGTNDKKPICNDNISFDPAILFRFNELILWGGHHYKEKLPESGSWLIWDKRNYDGTAFLSDGEMAWWNKGAGIYIYSQSGQKVRANSKGVHPTMKPIGLMRWCIEKTKSPGIILDAFAGSGSTGIAAKQIGRRFLLIEIEEKYCRIAVDRLRQEELF